MRRIVIVIAALAATSLNRDAAAWSSQDAAACNAGDREACRAILGELQGRQDGISPYVNQPRPRPLLEDRCYAGDQAACRMWQDGMQRAIEGMRTLYPPGWNR